ncbi:MAG: methylaspartate ammonia-lyase [Anaerolineae bacterium]
MTEIVQVLAVPAAGAYHYTDLAALQDNPVSLADQYTAPGVSPGFRRVREVAEAVSVGLVLSEGSVAWGDCVAVAYSGMAGRDPVFRIADGLSTIRHEVMPVLEGRRITAFREMAPAIDALTERTRIPVPQRAEPTDSEDLRRPVLSRRDLLTAPLRFLRNEGTEATAHEENETPSADYVAVERPLHTAIRYGVSQALLKAVALTRNTTMAEVIADEWGLPRPGRPVPIHAQSGGERCTNADKMIVRWVASLPHALVEDIPQQLGEDGEEMVRYVRWLVARIQELGGTEYRPSIHLDFHGALGRIYDNSLGRILGYLYRLESWVQPYTLRVESPVVMGTRDEQIEALRTLREYVQFRKMAVQIVADEWVNTLEDILEFVTAGAVDMIQIKMPDLGGVQNSVDAVLACKDGDVGAFLGGSCAETDLSARVAVHVALATQPDMIMAKPGMGVDEGVTIVQNEMTRALVEMKVRDRR